jgi:hypothetical protein
MQNLPRLSPLTLMLLVACGTGGGSSTTDGSVMNDSGMLPSDDEVVRMCLLNNACGYQSLLGVPADQCVETVYEARQASYTPYSPEHMLRHERMLECARTATTCDQYLACVRFDATCSGTVAGSCQGTVADRCSTPGTNYLPPIFDCALLGMTCEASGEALCVLPAGSDDCATPGQDRCDGDTRVLCRHRTGGGAGETRLVCPAGTACLLDGGEAVCAADYPTCSTLGGTCDGETSVVCRPMGAAGNRELRLDCGSVGRVCVLDDSDPDVTLSGCAPAASECTPATGSTTSAQCDGAAIEVCVEGRLERIECASVGRTSCMILPGIPGLQPATPVCI